MDTRVDHHVYNIASINCVHNVTWIENLKRGICALLLHPFLPFYFENTFNFSCLFSDKPYCCTEDAHRSTPEIDQEDLKHKPQQSYCYSSTLKNQLETLVGNYFSPNINNQQPLTGTAVQKHTFLSLIKDITAEAIYFLKAKPTRAFLISQLILCTTIFGYVIVKDIRYMMRYMKAIRTQK